MGPEIQRTDTSLAIQVYPLKDSSKWPSHLEQKFSAFLAFFAIVILYAIALAGSTGVFDDFHTAELFTNGTDSVSLYLGYLGACVSKPNSTQGTTTPFRPNSTTTSNTTSSPQCTGHLRVPTDAPSQPANSLIAGMDLTFPPSAIYNASLISMLERAGELRKTIFASTELIAACVLFALAGILLVLLWIASCVRHRKRTAPETTTIILFTCIALFLSFGFMAAGATTFELWHGQALLKAEGGVFSSSGVNSTNSKIPGRSGVVSVKTKPNLLRVVTGALAAGGIFISAFAIAAGSSAARALDTAKMGDNPHSGSHAGGWPWVPFPVSQVFQKKKKQQQNMYQVVQNYDQHTQAPAHGVPGHGKGKPHRGGWGKRKGPGRLARF